MKYRIVKYKNNKYRAQKKEKSFARWESLFYFEPSLKYKHNPRRGLMFLRQACKDTLWMAKKLIIEDIRRRERLKEAAEIDKVICEIEI